jgi:hypothetical protein
MRSPETSFSVRAMWKEPRMVADEEQTTVEIGHKNGRVVMNFYGTSEVDPNYIAWSPAQARAVARQIIASADRAEQS